MIIDLTKELKFKPNQKRSLEKRLENEIQKAPVVEEMLWIEGMENVKGVSSNYLYLIKIS
jgi:hypothetical protein